MFRLPPPRFSCSLALLAIVCFAPFAFSPAQSPDKPSPGQPLPDQPSDQAAFLSHLDAAVQARYDRVLAFTDVEHYSVFRGKDQTHPAAEMTVRITYRKGVGKSHVILSQTGSSIIQSLGLEPLLDSEEAINNPADVRRSWFTTENYAMKLLPGRSLLLRGVLCQAVSIKPRHRATNLIDGTLWVDPATFAILRVDGIASKRPSIFAGTTHMLRDYAFMDGFSQAIHARAQADSFFFGRTVVTIDYTDYHIQLSPGP